MSAWNCCGEYNEHAEWCLMNQRKLQNYDTLESQLSSSKKENNQLHSEVKMKVEVIHGLLDELSQTKAELAESEKVRWALVNQRDAWKQKAERLAECTKAWLTLSKPQNAVSRLLEQQAKQALAKFSEKPKGDEGI